MIEKYCKPGVSIKLAFTLSKISSYFSLKDIKGYKIFNRMWFMYLAEMDVRRVYYQQPEQKNC